MRFQPDEYDHIFHTKVDSWVNIKNKLYDLFTQNEIDVLKRAERSFDIEKRRIVFLSFENTFASLGGLAAVARHLPTWLTKSKEKVLFLTPFHTRNTQTQDALKKGSLQQCFKNKVFHLCNYEGKLTCYKEVDAEFPSYYLEISDRFFAGENPYGYEDKNELLLDSLAFSAAVPFALKQLGMTSNLLFHAHDWETAPIAITSKFAVISSILDHARTVLTLHNSFDTGLPNKYKTLFFGKQFQGDTVLQCTVPLLNGPLTTVSTPFAHELRYDPIQRGIFVDHLQTEFSMNPPVGIENGMFGEIKVPFSDESITQAENGDPKKLLSEKNKIRSNFISALKNLNDSRIIGSLKLSSVNNKTPIFFMSGRLDFMQKGFDVIFHAFEKLPRGKAKLFFCPSSRNENSSLDFFKKIADQCAGDIIIVPFRLSREQYNDFLQGSSYLVMPSFYEPFGAATEGLMNGTPVIARGTGGLWVQVNPFEELYIPALYGNILNFDSKMSKPTGFLYREDYPDSVAEKKWRELLNMPPENRCANPLFTAMVDSALNTLGMAIDTYSKPLFYSTMILNGLNSVNQFSWEKAVLKYQKVYDTVCFRGF